jgi:hypothetical protein
VLPQLATPFPDLSHLSDARLARLLVDVTAEVKRRKSGEAGRPSHPELEDGIREAARVLEAMLPKRAGRDKQPRSAGAAPPLQEGKRKAIRTALQAGVAPGQVAKHFGLSLAAVRKALTDE